LNPGFIFVSEAGTSTGFGHLTRQLALVDSAEPSEVQRNLCIVDDSQDSLQLTRSIAGVSVSDTSFIQSVQEIDTDTTDRVIFLDGRKLNSDSFKTHDAALTVILSPFIPLSTARSLGVFRGCSIPSNWLPKKHDVVLLGPEFAVVPTYLKSLREMQFRETRDLVEEICIFPGQKPSEKFWRVVQTVCDTALQESRITLWVPRIHERYTRCIWNSSSRVSPDIRITSTNRPWTQAKNSDLAITTGGQSSIEALCLGLPTIALPELATQKDFVYFLSSIGACISVPESATADVRHLATTAITTKALRESLSRIALQTIDGLGSSRIIDTVRSLI
jgi:spore coat polysaccharide biosynthesis predicted glycosyltransferase SpsG